MPPGCMSEFDLSEAEARDTVARRAPFCLDPRNTTILIVDDSPIDRKVLQESLDRLQWPAETRFAADGDEAWEELKATRPPTVVLTDMEMPGTGGIGLLRRIRGDPDTAAIPTFMVSASPERIRVQEAMAAGATAFFPKPTQAKEILALTKVVHAFSFHHCFTEPPEAPA